MQHAEHLTLAEMREFLSASSSLSFAGAGRDQIYALLERVLRTQKYLALTKKEKGIVRRYLVKISGLSVAQITRLIARWRRPRRHPAASFTAPPVPDSLHVRRYPAAGQSRWRPRRPLRPSRAPHITARIRSPRPGRIRKLGLDLGLPHLQLAAHPDLSRKACPSHQDPLHGGEHWRAPQARSAREAGLRAGRQRAPGRQPQRQGSLSHQCCRHRDAMAGRGLLRNHLRGPFIAGFRGPAASIPLPHPRLPLRQRLGVSQLQGAETVEQITGGTVHQVAGQSHHRQRFGGRQKRRGGAQTHRTRSDRLPSRRQSANAFIQRISTPI